MPEDDEPEDRWAAITRDLRRTTYLATALDLAAADVELAVAAVVAARAEGDSEARARHALRAALHYHLGGAWDDGAGARADMVSALDVARAVVARLRREVRELRRRVSDER